MHFGLQRTSDCMKRGDESPPIDRKLNAMNTKLLQSLVAAVPQWEAPHPPSLELDTSIFDSIFRGGVACEWNELAEIGCEIADKHSRLFAAALGSWMIAQPTPEAQTAGHYLLFSAADDAQCDERQLAMLIRSHHLFHGIGTPRDVGRAVHGLFKAHTRADSDEVLGLSFSMLGDMWATGLIDGVTDHELALQYYQVAAEGEFEMTGGPYRAGLFWDPNSDNKTRPDGVLADAEIASCYYDLAAEYGNEEAETKLSMLIASGHISADATEMH